MSIENAEEAVYIMNLKRVMLYHYLTPSIFMLWYKHWADASGGQVYQIAYSGGKVRYREERSDGAGPWWPWKDM